MMVKKLYEIAADIVNTQAGKKSMTSAEIATSLRTVFQTLWEMQKSEATGTALAMSEVTEGPQFPEVAPKAMDPKDSIQNDKVICLECGAEMKQLTKMHLSSHAMSAKEYKKKYSFPMKTALAAKSLTKARSKAAKKRGLPESLKKYLEARRPQEKPITAKVNRYVGTKKGKRT